MLKYLLAESVFFSAQIYAAKCLQKWKCTPISTDTMDLFVHHAKNSSQWLFDGLRIVAVIPPPPHPTLTTDEQNCLALDRGEICESHNCHP